VKVKYKDSYYSGGGDCYIVSKNNGKNLKIGGGKIKNYSFVKDFI